jgi:putative ABC transport system permease protein
VTARRYLRFWGRNIRADVDEELLFHLESRIAEYERAGVARADAERIAAERFGDLTAIAARLTAHDRSRQRRLKFWERIHQMRQDIVIALRSLRSRPGFAAAVILTLGLGITAVTSVASVAYSVLGAPLPMRDAARLVMLWGDNPSKQPAHFPLSGEEYRAFARETRSFNAVAAIDYQQTLPRLVQLGDTAVTIPGALVTGNFFDVLGAHPRVGRLLRPDDDRIGSPLVAVISERLWRSMFGGDAKIVGRPMKFYLRPMTIVGVVAGDLAFPRGAELWASGPNYSRARDTLPGFFDVIGRLAPSRTVADARNELGAFLSRPNEPHSGARLFLGQSLRPAAATIIEVLVGDVRPVLRVVIAAVVLLLLVTCLNVAGLMLIRTLARRREIAVRVALGARWSRIAQQTLCETILLSGAGGALGVACSWLAIRGFTSAAPATLARAQDAAINAPILIGTLALCVCVAVAFAAIPAALGTRLSLPATLAERRDGGTGPGARRVRALLIATQVAAAVVTLTAAGAVARGFQQLTHANFGFRPDHLIIARFGQTVSVGNNAAWSDVAWRAIENVRRIPGVTHATGLIVTPFRATGNDLAYSLPNDPPGVPPSRPMADYLGADPDYFDTFGITVQRGRGFTEEDRAGSEKVVVVDEVLARQAWPGKDPIGQRIGVGSTFFSVIGVVAPTRYRDLLAPRATMYTPFTQSPNFLPSFIAIRTSRDPQSLVPAIRNAARSADARVFLADFSTMTERIDSSLTTARLSALLLAAFALAILALTAVGLYSLIATFVRQREFELGVRMALGATPRNVAFHVMKQGIAIVGIGTVVGVSAAIAFGDMIASLGFAASPDDPVTLGSAALGVVLVAAIALIVPAGRASRASPADVLRRS